MEPLNEINPSKRGRKFGSKNRPKIDWRERKEHAWERLTKLGESENPPPALVRLWQSQIESCDKEIANEADERRERQRVKEFQSANQDKTETVPAPLVPAVPPVPDAKSVDPESERRLTNLLKQLGAQHERTPEPIPVEPSEPSELKKLEEAERDRVKQDAKKLAEAENKAAEELEKKAAAEEKQKRIVELRELRDGILKARNNPGFMLAAATNPTFARDGNQALRDIAAELDMLEDRLPAKSQSPQFDPEAYDRRRAAAEERELTARMLEGERIIAANRANARPAPISGGLGYCEGPEWNR